MTAFVTMQGSVLKGRLGAALRLEIPFNCTAPALNWCVISVFESQRFRASHRSIAIAGFENEEVVLVWFFDTFDVGRLQG